MAAKRDRIGEIVNKKKHFRAGYQRGVLPGELKNRKKNEKINDCLPGIDFRGISFPAASAPISPEADMTSGGFLFKALGLNDPILPPYGTYTGVKAYAKGSDPRDPLVSPVFGDYTGVTPMFLFCGTSELPGSDAHGTFIIFDFDIAQSTTYNPDVY